MITILGSIVNINVGREEPIWSFNEHKNLHLGNM